MDRATSPSAPRSARARARMTRVAPRSARARARMTRVAPRIKPHRSSTVRDAARITRDGRSSMRIADFGNCCAARGEADARPSAECAPRRTQRTPKTCDFDRATHVAAFGQQQLASPSLRTDSSSRAKAAATVASDSRSNKYRRATVAFGKNRNTCSIGGLTCASSLMDSAIDDDRSCIARIRALYRADQGLHRADERACGARHTFCSARYRRCSSP